MPQLIQQSSCLTWYKQEATLRRFSACVSVMRSDLTVGMGKSSLQSQITRLISFLYLRIMQITNLKIYFQQLIHFMLRLRDFTVKLQLFCIEVSCCKFSAQQSNTQTFRYQIVVKCLYSLHNAPVCFGHTLFHLH